MLAALSERRSRRAVSETKRTVVHRPSVILGATTATTGTDDEQAARGSEWSIDKARPVGRRDLADQAPRSVATEAPTGDRSAPCRAGKIDGITGTWELIEASGPWRSTSTIPPGSRLPARRDCRRLSRVRCCATSLVDHGAVRFCESADHLRVVGLAARRPRAYKGAPLDQLWLAGRCRHRSATPVSPFPACRRAFGGS